MRFRHFVLIVAVIAAFQGTFLAKEGRQARVHAQEAASEPASDETTQNNAGSSLDSTQQAISRRYKRFEETLLKMAELMRKTDPERAELLRRVIGKSKEQFIAIRMDKLVELLEKESFGNAIEQQDELVLELTALLDLLGSEDRAKEIEEEKKRLQDLIRNVDALLGKQKGLRADTERGAGEKGLQERQRDLEERTQKLGEKIDRQDQKKAQDLQGDQEPGGEKSDGQKTDAEKSDGKKPDGEKPDGEKSDGQKSDGQKSDGQKSDGQKSDGQKSDGQKSDGQKSDGQQQQQQQQPSTPGRQEVEQARKAMQDALDKLKEGQRDDASQDQTDAIAKLQQAKERLEEILRQLREEERERMLTKLEDRFQQMLAVQILIYDNTVPLGKIPEDQRETRHISKAKELARKEAELALEAEKALTLLKDEGSSVAFPEAVEQMRDDMRTVTTRLEAAQVGELTQGIEQDIIETLEELVEALQREIEQGKTKPQDQKKQQQQKRKEELLNKLAELKMLRSLQLRINRGTKRLGRLFDGEQAEQQDILDQLRILGERQRRVQKATNDIATGKNQ
ncbi:hypothetical protein Mal52_38830 [Symmachiella dynata]|uniref:Uncharacterized protein n=1 Tax=Symmachiella dynata TaxID=2527995 RepID=A0A517ZSC3_9PLAN|nr:hypothetical protein [Symmachiella dynata]QDU45389.1 hypothetical protein Mal52_38830 [Symmachiella dynata]